MYTELSEHDRVEDSYMTVQELLALIGQEYGIPDDRRADRTPRGVQTDP